MLRMLRSRAARNEDGKKPNFGSDGALSLHWLRCGQIVNEQMWVLVISRAGMRLACMQFSGYYRCQAYMVVSVTAHEGGLQHDLLVGCRFWHGYRSPSQSLHLLWLQNAALVHLMH